MLGIIFLLIITPIALGYIIRRIFRSDYAGFGLITYVLGFLTMLAQFTPICYFATWRDILFHRVAAFTGILFGAECLVAVFLWIRQRRAESKTIFPSFSADDIRESLRSLIRSPWFWITVIVCGFQIARLFFGQTCEPRDSKTYNALMNDIWQSDHLFRIIPKTGRIVASPLDMYIKLILSAWYAFLPMLARISGLHPLIIANTVMPAYVTLLHYIVIYSLGRFLFRENKQAAFMMTAICALLYEFTLNLSIQSQIMLLWPVWGKSVLARLVIPAVLLVYTLWASKAYRAATAGVICAGLICCIAGCALSPMASVVIPIELGLLGLIWAVRNRSFRPVIISAVTCIPALVYLVCYYMLTN